MAEKKKRGFWRTCRIYFRRFRIAVWCCVLVLLSCVLYLNQVGLPNFIKEPLLERLRARGIELEFTRMRWRWNHGIVAENVRFLRSDSSLPGPRFSVREAQVQLDWAALLKLQLQVRGLVLHEGELTWEMPANETSAGEQLSLQKIETQLRLLPGDLWALENFRAQFAGAELHIGGTLTNASAIRDLMRARRTRPSEPGAVERRLRQLADALEQIQFASAPELHLDIQGDARNLQSFTVRLNVNTPDARTPWGTVQNGFLTAVLHPATSNELSHAEIALEAASARTPWAAAANLNLQLHLISSTPDTNVVDARLALSAQSLETKWATASSGRVEALWRHALTNAMPLAGQIELIVERAHSPSADVEHGEFNARFEPATNAVSVSEEWAVWAKLAPYALRWDCALRGVESPKVQLRTFACAGSWSAPNLDLNRIASELYDGSLQAHASVDVATRQFNFGGSSDFDVHRIDGLLTAKSRAWVGQFGWKQSPLLRASGHLQLPAWTNLAKADWRNEVRPSIRLDGHFAVGEGSFRGVEFNSAASHFSYSNLFWRLPDLVARRSEGELKLVHISNEATRDYHFQIYSAIHPLALKPLLEPKQHRIYEILGFDLPPVIEGEIRGRWYDHASIGASIRVAATNFSVRAEKFEGASCTLEYTNQFIRIREAQGRRGVEWATAEIIDIDVPARKLYLTNGTGVVRPQGVVRAVGPKVAKHMEPYQFGEPVTGKVNGVIPLRDERDADVVFEIQGGPFEWWRFNVPFIAGRIYWRGEHLELQNLRANFYRGSAIGDAAFDFRNRDGVRYRFDMKADAADLNLLMSDLTDRTNRLEGRLTGRLTIAECIATNLSTLQGSGRVSLADGLIWDIPLFGVLSPVLDGIAPGLELGSSRAREGSMSFTITNGVAHTEDLEIRASMMRLQYWGTLNLESHRLDARAQAELFRDTWVVGKLVSMTLWPVSKIFEYRFTGTLQEPKSEPVFFVPKILLLPFHPIRTLKELAPQPSSEPGYFFME